MTQINADLLLDRGLLRSTTERLSVLEGQPAHHDPNSICVICVHLRPVLIGAICGYAKRGLRGRAGVSVAGGRDGRLRYHSIAMLSGARITEMNCEVERTSKMKPRSSPR